MDNTIKYADTVYKRMTERIDELEQENSRLYRIIDSITAEVDKAIGLVKIEPTPKGYKESEESALKHIRSVIKKYIEES